MIQMAHLAKKSGNLLTCEQRLRSVIDLLIALNDEESLMIRAKASRLLATSLSEVQRFDEAEQLFLEAKDICKYFAKELSFILHGLGYLYIYKCQFDDAILLLKETLSMKKSLSLTSEDILPTLYGLGLCYIKTKRFDEALKVINDYETLVDDENDNNLEVLWANFFGHQDDWDKVIEKLETIQLRSRVTLSPWTYTMLEMSLAHAYNQLEEYEIAEKYFWNALSSIEEYMHKWLSTSTRVGLRGTFLSGIEQQFQAWRLRSKYDKTANYKLLSVVERLSAIDLRAKLDTELNAVNISTSTVQTLSEGELLIYFFGTNLTLYTFILDKDGIILDDSITYNEYSQFHSLSKHNYRDYFDIDELDENFTASIKTVVVNTLLLFEVHKEVNKICLLLPFGKGNNIPWDYFIRNAHMFSEQQRPEIFKTVPISRLPSFSVYKSLKNRVQKSCGRPAVFVNPVGRFPPLPETNEEAEQIKLLFPEARIFSGRKASIGNLMNVIRPSFLHMSCHGFFDKAQPLRSSLMLSSNDLSEADEEAWRAWQEDLLLFLMQNPLAEEDIYNHSVPTQYEGKFEAALFRFLKLRSTEFVFLSACSAARVADYDEIHGFAQSVFLAGCPNLIAPLWPVDTKTTLLFVKEFYKEYKNLTDIGILRAGKIGKCVALAKNALLRKDICNREVSAWTVFGLS